jgi:dihydroflavonol-4-reductase
VAGETLLVTGANGLVGSNLCINAARAGYRVRAMVRNPAGTAPLQQPGIEIVAGDVTHRDSLLRAADGTTGILHCAAVLGGTWTTSTPEEFWAVNYHGVVNVMEAGRQCGVRRVVDIDTLAVMDWRTTITERSSLLPISPRQLALCPQQAGIGV